MRLSLRSGAILALTTLIVVVLVWSIIRDRGSEPYSIQGDELAGWTLVTSQGDEPWVVALRPPSSLTTRLFQQLSEKTGQTLVAAPSAALPLVLRGEYDDGLQGVQGIDAIVRMAQESGVERERLEPVCIGHRVARGREIFFVAFSSPAFWQLRADLLPDHPEHAGVGVYDPRALSPILPLAATDRDVAAWWPIVLDQVGDCQAQVTIR